MASGLIELEDGFLVEAEVEEGSFDIASGVEQVSKGLDQIGPLLKKVCKPVTSVWRELNRDVAVDTVEIQLGVSFEGSGNLFVAKAKAGANLNIKLVLKAKPLES